MSIEKLIQDAADECDWDPDTVVSVLAEFIDEYSDPDDFKAFLERRVAEDGGGEDYDDEDAEPDEEDEY